MQLCEVGTEKGYQEMCAVYSLQQSLTERGGKEQEVGSVSRSIDQRVSQEINKKSSLVDGYVDE